VASSRSRSRSMVRSSVALMRALAPQRQYHWPLDARQLESQRQISAARRLAGHSAGDGSRLGEGRAEVGHPLETVFACLGRAAPEQGAGRDEPGVIDDHERGQ
jgi:hypothetical protein